MAEFNDRVVSFKTRFSATQAQASYLLHWVERLGREDVESSIASRIMQDDDLKQIGYHYVDRDAEYLSGINRNDAYRRVMREMTADIVDELFSVMPKDTAPTPR